MTQTGWMMLGAVFFMGAVIIATRQYDQIGFLIVGVSMGFYIAKRIER